MITIKDFDMESYLYGVNGVDEEPIFTKNFDDIQGFESLEDAEEFANTYLDDEYSYAIVNVEKIIKYEESTLKTINY